MTCPPCPCGKCEHGLKPLKERPSFCRADCPDYIIYEEGKEKAYAERKKRFKEIEDRESFEDRIFKRYRANQRY